MLKKWHQFNESKEDVAEEQAISLIQKYGLDYYFGIVIRHSKSNNAPYHNLHHILCMIKNCYAIAKDEKINDNTIRPILIACLFHDFNHSMGEKTDAENVKDAIAAFKQYSKEDENTNDMIVGMIQATQYPYVVPDSELNAGDQIIRDADLLQWCEENHIQQIVFGLLQNEMKGDVKENISKYRDFVAGAKFYTDYGQKKYDKYKDIKLSEYEYIIKMMSNND
jgi:predicted metal-dependent HD superfamily phosphohydrolase